MSDKRIVVLIEDNEDDERLTRRALMRTNVNNEIVAAVDGEQALDLLHGGEGPSADQIALIVLDLSLPKRSGIEVLRTLRIHPSTELVPVVILTSDASPTSIREAFEAGANSFIIKPEDAESFSEAILNMAMYWLLLNQTSRNGRSA